jgi:hypothetical protein
MTLADGTMPTRSRASLRTSFFWSNISFLGIRIRAIRFSIGPWVGLGRVDVARPAFLQWKCIVAISRTKETA